jgi:hypothetical protein
MIRTTYVLIALILQISELSGQLVGTTRDESTNAGTVETNASDARQPLVKKAIDGLSSLNSLRAEATPSSAVLWVRMSKGYLEDYVTRNVDRKKPVRDYILGTTLTGESHTTGKTRLVLHPGEQQALGEVEFVGEVRSRTSGRNGPARLQYLSDSTFRARKKLVIGESGLIASPATADASSRLTLTGLQTTLPGLRGRIAQRIATRREANSRSQANAIVSDHTADDIRRDLDRKLNEAVAAIQTNIHAQIAALKLNEGDRPMAMRSKSTPDYVEVALYRSGGKAEESQLPTFVVDGNPDFTVRVHRTVLARALTGGELPETFAPIVGGVLAGRVDATRDTTDLKATNMSMEGEWLALDFAVASGGEETASRVALDDVRTERQLK